MLIRLLHASQIYNSTNSYKVLDKRIVHKTFEKNVMVAEIEDIASHPGYFIGKLHFDPMHDFFFEHSIDHIPGLMLIEGVRQFILAVFEVYYKTNFDPYIIVESIKVDFSYFAEKNTPTYVIGFCEIPPNLEASSEYKNQHFISYCYVTQGDQIITKIEISTHVRDAKFMHKIREKQLSLIKHKKQN